MTSYTYWCILISRGQDETRTGDTAMTLYINITTDQGELVDRLEIDTEDYNLDHPMSWRAIGEDVAHAMKVAVEARRVEEAA